MTIENVDDGPDTYRFTINEIAEALSGRISKATINVIVEILGSNPVPPNESDQGPL